MKKFLLIAGSSYYPQAYTDDWQGCYVDWYEIVNLEEWMNK